MDDLDREIEQAARDTRRRQRQGRLATLASTAAFFLVAVVGTIVMFTLFPEPDVSDYDVQRSENKAQHGDPSVTTLASEYSAHRSDQSRVRWKALPVFALAFASAIFVRHRLKPRDKGAGA